MTDNPYAADVQPAERPTRIRLEVVALLGLAAAIAYVARNAVSVAESSIRADLGLSIRQSGWFMGTFFWTYAVLQIPGGRLAQARGTRAAMILFAGGWSLATLCIGLAPGLWLLLLAQLMMGATQAGIFPASCYSISHWVPVSRRTLACGILAVGMQVGAIIAALITGPLIRGLGWRLVFVAYAIPGFLWAAAFLLRFRDDPRKDPRVNVAERELIQAESASSADPQAQTPTPWGAIARNPAIWFLCGQQICRAAGYMFFASWFPTFLQQTRGVSVQGSGYLQALVFCGTLTGCLGGGLLTDWIFQQTGSLRLSRSGVGAAFLGGCALLILAAWFVDDTVVAVGLLAVGAFFAAMAGPCAFSATIDLGGKHVPQVFGLMNMTGNFAAAACPILVAELFEWTSNWTIVLLVFAGIYLLGAISWALVDCRRHI